MTLAPRTWLATALAVALLLSGCVNASGPDAALQATEALGEVADPLPKQQAKRLAGAIAKGDKKAGGKGTQEGQRRKKGEPNDTGDGDGDGGPDGSGGGPSSGGGEDSRATGDNDGSDGGGGNTSSNGSDGKDGGDDDGPQPTPSAPAPFRTVADAPDAPGDAGAQSPGYADVRRLLVESNGEAVRVSIAVNGDIPGALADGEVQGIGVDFYRSNDDESDYQLFADGGYKGWRAFLQTPKGLVPYPGSFAVGGQGLVFEVPWSSLGGAKTAGVSMFLDWSAESPVLNKAGSDHVPANGTYTVRPQ